MGVQVGIRYLGASARIKDESEHAVCGIRLLAPRTWDIWSENSQVLTTVCCFSLPRFVCGTGVKSVQDWWSGIVGQRIRWLSGCWTRSYKSAAKRRRCGRPSYRAPSPRHHLPSREPRRQPTGLSPGTLMSQRGLCDRTWALKDTWVVRFGVLGCLVLGKECGTTRCLVVKISDKWDTVRGHPFEKTQKGIFSSL